MGLPERWLFAGTLCHHLGNVSTLDMHKVKERCRKKLTKSRQVNQHITLVMLIPSNLSLANSPPNRRLSIELGENLRLPALLTAPEILVLVQIESVFCLYPGKVGVTGVRPSSDRVRRAAPDVDVLRALIAVGTLVSVFGGRVGIPPEPSVAEALGDRGSVVDDLDLGDASA